MEVDLSRDFELVQVDDPDEESPPSSIATSRFPKREPQSSVDTPVGSVSSAMPHGSLSLGEAAAKLTMVRLARQVRPNLE